MNCHVALAGIKKLLAQTKVQCLNVNVQNPSWFSSFMEVNRFVGRFSDGHATLYRKRVYQINYFSYVHP